jgi:hypothetical protein
VGVDVSPVMRKVVDAAVAKIYGGKRQIHWMEIYAGEKPWACTAPICGCRPKPWTRCAPIRCPSRGR